MIEITEKDNRDKIHGLVVELGKRLASLNEVVLVEINVEVSTGSEINYSSVRDPEYKDKYISYQERGM